MSIDNIAEKCQRLRSIPLETLDIDSKLKVIQVQVNFIFLLQLEDIKKFEVYKNKITKLNVNFVMVLNFKEWVSCDH